MHARVECRRDFSTQPTHSRERPRGAYAREAQESGQVTENTLDMTDTHQFITERFVAFRHAESKREESLDMLDTHNPVAGPLIASIQLLIFNLHAREKGSKL